MRIAVLIVGEYRTFPYCHKTMDFLYQPPSTGIHVDVFFSTWSVTKTHNPLINKLGPNKVTSTKEVTEQEIRKLLARPATVRVLPPIPLREKDSFLAMRMGWLLGFELIEQSGVEYDYVYVMRPDLFFKEQYITLFTGVGYERYQNAIGVLPTTPKTCADCDFFSTYDNIKKLLSPDILKLDQANGHLHELWYNYIIDKGFDFTTLPFTVAEPHCIGRFPMSDTSTWNEVQTNYWNLFNNRPI